MQHQGNIIVTGGAGYIGSHVCKALKLAGFKPVVIDNLSNGFKELVKWGKLEIGDINDKNLLDEVFKKYSPTAVIHCAGLISVEESTRKPDIYFQNNSHATETLLEAMHKNNIRHLIYSSTASVYGNVTAKSITEGQITSPQNPYAESKLKAENAIKKYAAEKKISAIILRYFNAAGADAEGETGEMHNPETHLIPLAIKAALNGTEFNLYGDGRVVRDYVHVTDLANAHILALEHSFKHTGYEVINIGTGKGYTVNEILDSVEKLSGKSLRVKPSNERAGDVPILVADINKAKALLGYKPQHSELTNIINTAIKWHASNP